MQATLAPSVLGSALADARDRGTERSAQAQRIHSRVPMPHTRQERSASTQNGGGILYYTL